MLWLSAIVTVFLLALANQAEAAFKTVVGGVTVSYSGSGAAYFDADDGTLTVRIDSDGGNLVVTVGSTASASWGSGVDVYILANNAVLNSISVKGNSTCIAYVCGDVWYVKKFSLSLGVIGDTIFYGVDFGLGMGAQSVPATISMKNSYATAQLFGYPNQ
jgi:hypothetical protein